MKTPVELLRDTLTDDAIAEVASCVIVLQHRDGRFLVRRAKAGGDELLPSETIGLLRLAQMEQELGVTDRWRAATKIDVADQTLPRRPM